MNRQPHNYFGTAAQQRAIYQRPRSLEDIAAQFQQVNDILKDESLPQDAGIQLTAVNYFKVTQLGGIVDRPTWSRTERGEIIYNSIIADINLIFNSVGVSTSRVNLITLVEDLVNLAEKVEDVHNLDFFREFGMRLSSKLYMEVRRAVKEAGEIAQWRRNRVFERDIALANRMSDIYGFTSIFGAGPFSQTFPYEFQQVSRAYQKTVKADVREAAQSGNGSPEAFFNNGIIASHYIFGTPIDFDARATFRGANHRANPQAAYRKNI